MDEQCKLVGLFAVELEPVSLQNGRYFLHFSGQYKVVVEVEVTFGGGSLREVPVVKL